MRVGKLFGVLVLRVVGLGLALGVGFAGGAAGLSAFQDRFMSSTRVKRDILLVPEASCSGDRLYCAKILHFNGDWNGTTLCRAGHCVGFTEVFGGR